MIKFKSEHVYTNRYRDEYKFVKMGENTFKFDGSNSMMEYCRMGGKEGQKEIDINDLGMFDPSGGPYLTPGDFDIDGRKAVRIFGGDYVGVEVE